MIDQGVLLNEALDGEMDGQNHSERWWLDGWMIIIQNNTSKVEYAYLVVVVVE